MKMIVFDEKKNLACKRFVVKNEEEETAYIDVISSHDDESNVEFWFFAPNGGDPVKEILLEVKGNINDDEWVMSILVALIKNGNVNREFEAHKKRLVWFSHGEWDWDFDTIGLVMGDIDYLDLKQNHLRDVELN
ncbi:MAG: hypothetical protein LUH58_00800 [Lachnospiraceae bacterium]|nr:hypothetical protein [Lachnospiraceae bacterium]